MGDSLTALLEKALTHLAAAPGQRSILNQTPKGSNLNGCDAIPKNWLHACTSLRLGGSCGGFCARIVNDSKNHANPVSPLKAAANQRKPPRIAPSLSIHRTTRKRGLHLMFADMQALPLYHIPARNVMPSMAPGIMLIAKFVMARDPHLIEFSCA